MIEPGPFAQDIAGVDVFGREVYASNPPPIPAGNETRRATEAAPNVESMRLSGEAELTETLLRSFATPIGNRVRS